MKVLNLYAGLGGNRRLWGDEHEIHAVEFNPDIASVYQDLFPTDIVHIADAHQYLLDHYKEYDFIWASPPCQTHSSFRHNIGVKFRGVEPVYPDMKLYQEIIFLQHHAECNWVIENVKPYYTPLVQPKCELQRHLFWSNKFIPPRNFVSSVLRNAQIPDLQQLHNIDLSSYKIANKRQILRNCVHRDIGLYVFEQVMKEEQKELL